MWREEGLKHVYVVGTADTKGPELAYLAEVIAGTGVPVVLVDVGTREPSIRVDIAASEVASCHPDGAGAVLSGDDRGVAVAAMSVAFSIFITGRQDIAGIIGIGGGGGTSIVTAGMRGLPYGLPKIMVSTLASGDVGPYVDISDIVMMPSVTDFAGLNQLSRMIVHNAAHAISGMVGSVYQAREEQSSVGLTMFGVTTQCVTAMVEQLKSSHDCSTSPPPKSATCSSVACCRLRRRVLMQSRALAFPMSAPLGRSIWSISGPRKPCLQLLRDVNSIITTAMSH